MKVTDTLTQEDFHGAFHKLLERYNKCISAGGDYFEGDESSMCVLSIKVPIRKKSGNLFNDPRVYIVIYLLPVYLVQGFSTFSYTPVQTLESTLKPCEPKMRKLTTPRATAVVGKLSIYVAIQTLLHELDSTQGQYFKISLTGFPSPRLVAIPRLMSLVCLTMYP